MQELRGEYGVNNEMYRGSTDALTKCVSVVVLVLMLVKPPSYVLLLLCLSV